MNEEANGAAETVKTIAISVVKITFGTLKFLCDAVLKAVEKDNS